jgi:predicted nucleotidyltransferase
VTARWRILQAERLQEAVEVIGSIKGVVGVVVAGSVGRGEAWPLSDIDLVPIVREKSTALEEIGRLQADLVDWWAASGHAQTLDVGWLAFTEAEVRRAITFEPAEVINLLGEPRWFHGLDKVYGGYGDADRHGLAEAFAAWATAIRFDPLVRERRARQALADVRHNQRLLAEAIERGDPVKATHDLRTAARGVRLIHVEHWSERLGSLGREWTHFERLAAKHGEADLAARLGDLAGADIAETSRRAVGAPAWLVERIELAYQGRVLVGEDVSEAESRRDQIAAFAHLALGRSFARPGGWLGVPDPDLARKQSELGDLLASE